jgi:hypothetical protein
LSKENSFLSQAIFIHCDVWPAFTAEVKTFPVCISFKGKAIGLPDDFLALKEGSKGGGVIQVKMSLVMSSVKNF